MNAIEIEERVVAVLDGVLGHAYRLAPPAAPARELPQAPDLADAAKRTRAASPAIPSASTRSAWATIDADGMIDFLITSAWSGIRGFHSGRMFIISSGVPGRPSRR